MEPSESNKRHTCVCAVLQVYCMLVRLSRRHLATVCVCVCVCVCVHFIFLVIATHTIFVGYCRILQDIVGYCRILQDIVGYYRILQDIVGYCRIL